MRRGWLALLGFAGAVLALQLWAGQAFADTPAPTVSPTDSAATPGASPSPTPATDSPSPAPTVTETVTVAPSPAPSDSTVRLADDQLGPLLWAILGGFAILVLFAGVSAAKVLFGR